MPGMSSNSTLASLAETKAFAFEFSEKLKPGMLIGFSGELGSGKTTLIRYICEALGVQEQVASPTFVLQHEYTCKNSFKIEHWDLYRVKGLPTELDEPCANDTIRMVEWIEKFPALFAEAELRLELSIPNTKSDPAETRIVKVLP